VLQATGYKASYGTVLNVRVPVHTNSTVVRPVSTDKTTHHSLFKPGGTGYYQYRKYSTMELVLYMIDEQIFLSHNSTESVSILV
jgi:hypothetical protein